MKRLLFILVAILVLSTFWSCEKDNEISILDELKQKEYYDAEIFEEEYLDIYGKWELIGLCGGFAGTCLDVSEGIYLQIVEYGVYGYFADDAIIRSGRIDIRETGSNFLLIEFKNLNVFGNGSIMLYSPKLEVKDTLVLFPQCNDCFIPSFKRAEE